MGTIAGRVTDVSGVGIPDVWVYYGDPNPTAVTAADGTFSVDVAPGEYSIYLSPSDSVHIPEYWDDGNPFTVSEGETVTLNAQLASYGSISGTVADDAGHALDDVLVYLYYEGGSYDWIHTGDDGDFAFMFLAPGDYTIFFDNGDPLYTDEWWQDAAGQQDADPISVGDGAAVALPTAHITTAPTGAISGTVRDADTLTGLDGVWATLQRDDGSYTYFAYADAAGHYEFDEVANGTYTLHFQHPSGIHWYLEEWWDDAPNADSATPIVVAGGADLTLNADLTPSPVGSLGGTVTNDAGQPITSAFVEVYATSGHNAGANLWTFTDTLGRYEFPRLVAGDYQVHFYPDTDFYFAEWWNNQPTQGAADLFTVSDGVSSTLNATLASAPTGTLTGTVTDDDPTDPDGLADVSVQAYNLDTGYGHYATTDADGQYSLVVPAGTYQIWFGAPYPYIGESWRDGEHLTVPEGGTAVADAALALEVPTAPDAPWCLGAEVALPGNGVGSGQVRLTWCTPNENGAAITDYVIQYSGNGGSTWSTFADGTSTADQATVTGLTNGTPYLLRVAAVNSVGQGDWTTTDTTATPRGVPGAPTNLGVDVAPASGVGSGQARLTWSAPAANGAAITDYLVQYSTTGGTSWTTYSDGTSTSTTALLSSLSNGTPHLFRVLAVNVAGQGSPSSTVSATPNTGIGVPGVPTGLTAQVASPANSLTSGQVGLSWTAPANDGGSPITDYIVEYSANGGTSWSTFADGTSTSTSATVTGLTNGTPYTFRVRAENVAGQGSPSATTTATPRSVPGVPTGLAAEVAPEIGVGSGEVRVSWTAPVNAGGSPITDYVVQFSSNGGTTWTTFADATSPATTAIVTGLTNGTGYAFRVAAVNAAGQGAPSATVTATPRTVPAAPTSLTAESAPANGVGSGQLRLSWTAPANTGGSPITDYVVQYSSNGGTTWTTFADGTSTVTTAMVTGLTNGTEYTVRVSAVNAAGQGAASATAVATPNQPPDVPDAPTGLTAAVAPTGGVGSGEVRLSWTTPANNGAAITDYVVEYSSNGGSSWSTFADAISTATSATVSGLTNGTPYTFRVAAVNSVGQGVASATVAATPRTVPSAPSGLSAAVAPVGGVGSGQVALAWIAPISNGGSAITDYVVEFSSNGGSSWSTFADGTSTATSVTVSGLTNGTEYSFRVSAVSAAGTGAASPTVTATPRSVPGAPTGLAAAVALPANAVGSGEVVLSWTAPAFNGGSAITDYVVEFSSNGGGSWSTFADATSTVTSVTVSGLANGTEYSFRVSAVNAAGTGAASATASATPRTVPGAPSGLTAAVAPAAGVGSGEVRLSWTAPVNGGSILTDYVVEFSSNGGSSWSTFADATSTATSATVTGLANGTAYSFRVSAVNAAGTGAASATASATPRTKPGAPRSVTAVVAPASGVGSGQVKVSWSAPTSTGGSPITAYVVQRSTNGTTWTTVATTGTTARSHVAAGLANGTRYQFRVLARNAVGDTASATVLATPRTRSSAPRFVIAVVAPAPGVGSGQVRIGWLAPASTGGSAITGYVIQRSSNGSAWTTLALTSASARTFKATGLTNGTRYYFRVLARNAVGDTASAMVSAIPRTVPSAPRAVTATPGSRRVKLTWAAPSANGGSAIRGYAVQRWTGTKWITITTAAASARSFTATGLINGTRYSFRVIAINGAGFGSPSSTVSAVPR